MGCVSICLAPRKRYSVIDIKKATQDLEIYSRAYNREKLCRKKAEMTLEVKSRELFLSNESLRNRNKELEKANRLLEQQSYIIDGLTSRYGGITRELRLAADVQRDMLPSPLLIPSIHAAGRYHPAYFLAGDCYDYHLVNDHLFAFYIADVAGHGVSSALVSFAIQSHFNSDKSTYRKYERRSESRLQKGVLEAISEMNQKFCKDEVMTRLFTMFYGLIDLRTGEMCYCQAGHPAMIVLNAKDGSLVEHGTGGFPLGIFADSEFDVHQIQLESNDRVVVYSDGVTDCENGEGAEFGIARLRQSIEDSATLGVIEAADYIERELLKWQGCDRFEDDVSIVVIDYRASSSETASRC